MKPSHIRTPRSLSECYFEVGHYVVEPSMWSNKWTAEKISGSENNMSKLLTAGSAVVLAVTVILAILVQPLI